MKLSAAQRKRLEEIQKEIDARLETLLTEDQKRQLQAMQRRPAVADRAAAVLRAAGRSSAPSAMQPAFLDSRARPDTGKNPGGIAAEGAGEEGGPKEGLRARHLVEMMTGEFARNRESPRRSPPHRLGAVALTDSESPYSGPA